MTYCAGRSGTRTRLGIAISRPRGWLATSVGRPTVSAGLVMPNDLLPQDLRLGQCQGCVSSRGRYTRESNRRVQIVSLPPDQIGSTNAPLYSAQRTWYLKMWCWAPRVAKGIRTGFELSAVHGSVEAPDRS